MSIGKKCDYCNVNFPTSQCKICLRKICGKCVAIVDKVCANCKHLVNGTPPVSQKSPNQFKQQFKY